MKSKKGFFARKEKAGVFDKKLHELTEEELSQVVGGAPDFIALSKAEACLGIFSKRYVEVAKAFLLNRGGTIRYSQMS